MKKTKTAKKFEIKDQLTYNAELSNAYSEKLECKNCGHIQFRNAEIHELKSSVDSKNSFYATVIQKFVCPECDSEDFVSSLVKGKITSEDNIISVNKQI